MDDTRHPKYGLKKLAKTLFNTKKKGYQKGYKGVMFLWGLPNGHKFPLGFALWYQGTSKRTELAWEGRSVLRNRFNLNPLGVLGEGGYASDEIIKRITDDGWPLALRFRNDRNLSGQSIRNRIPRGYGETEGTIQNGTKLKIIREKKHFFACNRMGVRTQADTGGLRFTLEGGRMI